MPSTFVHGFLPASCVTMSLREQGLSKAELIRLGALGFFLGNSPDLDVLASLISPDQFHVIHRNWGHNLISISLLSLLGTWLLRKFVSNRISLRRAAYVSTSLVFSHVFLDALCGITPDGLRFGVPLFFPFSNWEFILPWQLFKHYEMSKTLHPLLAHASSSDFWLHAFFNEAFISASLFCGWFVGQQISGWLIRLAKSQTSDRRDTPLLTPAMQESVQIEAHRRVR